MFRLLLLARAARPRLLLSFFLSVDDGDIYFKERQQPRSTGLFQFHNIVFFLFVIFYPLNLLC
jgi:hypothetical protein